MSIKDMPHVTVEQVLELRKAAMELEAEVKALRGALKLLDSGYETGRNPDVESEEVAAVYHVTGGLNDREYELVATDVTVFHALVKLQDKRGK